MQGPIYRELRRCLQQDRLAALAVKRLADSRLTVLDPGSHSALVSSATVRRLVEDEA